MSAAGNAPSKDDVSRIRTESAGKPGAPNLALYSGLYDDAYLYGAEDPLADSLVPKHVPAPLQSSATGVIVDLPNPAADTAVFPNAIPSPIMCPAPIDSHQPSTPENVMTNEVVPLENLSLLPFDSVDFALPQTEQIYTDALSTAALQIDELSWWTTDKDIIQIATLATKDPDCVSELSFFEHKVNGKSRGSVWILFTSVEAAAKTKAQFESIEIDQRVPIVIYTDPMANPFRTLPKEAHLRNPNIMQQQQQQPPPPNFNYPQQMQPQNQIPQQQAQYPGIPRPGQQAYSSTMGAMAQPLQLPPPPQLLPQQQNHPSHHHHHHHQQQPPYAHGQNPQHYQQQHHPNSHPQHNQHHHQSGYISSHPLPPPGARGHSPGLRNNMRPGQSGPNPYIPGGGGMPPIPPHNQGSGGGGYRSRPPRGGRGYHDDHKGPPRGRYH